MSSSGTIAIIGGGPRGISVLERLAAQLAAETGDTGGGSADTVTVHLVDDTEPGAGRVWRTNQTRTLCMNTLADAVTLFTEPGSTVTAPVVEGPTMFEWIELIRGDDLSETADPHGAKTALFRGHPAMVRGEFHSEIAATQPESHPSRALYGEYLRWVLSVVLARIPGNLKVEVHQARATEITQVTGDDGIVRDEITLERHTSGDAAHLASSPVTVVADATVLALGWTGNEPDALEGFTATSVQMHPTLHWVRPGNPADQAVDAVGAGEEIVVRGLGMGFFDLMAMVTIDRGGRFVTDTTSRSGLAYRPSGREPKLVVASHHGYPYQPKPVLHALPSPAPMPRFRSALAGLPEDAPAGSVDFGETLWPAILRDAQAAYYTVLLSGRCPGHAAEADRLAAVLTVIDDPALNPWRLHTYPELQDLVPEDDRFDLGFYADPVATFEGKTIAELTEFLGDRLAADLHEANLGQDSAVKAGLQVIGSARKPAQVADEPGRFTTRSRRAEYAELRRVGQMVGSGPPAFRTAELLCLVDAGYVRFLGAHPTLVVDPEQPAFAMSSPTTGDEAVFSTTLVDAWLHKPDARTSADPLTRQLRLAGRLRPFTLADGSVTTAPEVDLATGRLVHPDGAVDPRVHMLGIPLLDYRADMTISPMPRTDPLMLQETDGAAVSALRIAQVSRD